MVISANTYLANIDEVSETSARPLTLFHRLRDPKYRVISKIFFKLTPEFKIFLSYCVKNFQCSCIHSYICMIVNNF